MGLGPALFGLLFWLSDVHLSENAPLEQEQTGASPAVNSTANVQLVGQGVGGGDGNQRTTCTPCEHYWVVVSPGGVVT